MKASVLLNQIRHDEIVAAIRDAEMKTSGEIRVFISRKRVFEPVSVARRHFVRLAMTRTRERNGVLFFIAPVTHRFAVVGDSGIHARCGQTFWDELAKEMSGHFRKSEFTQGILCGIRKAADLMALHFPRRPDDQNELPDEIVRD